MPHFVIDCSENVVARHDQRAIMQLVFDVANDSGLFDVENIKVRLRAFSEYLAGSEDADFLHVFAYIMQGRNEDQKESLSRAVVTRLTSELSDVPIVSMNVMDFEKATYHNRASVAGQ